MGNRRELSAGGYIVLDALLALFLAAVTVVASLGLISAVVRRAFRMDRVVIELIEERSAYVERRTAVFVRK